MNNVKQTNEGIIQGIKLATDSIRASYGNFGTNAGIECDEYPFAKISNDAFEIIESIKTTDREERIGLNLFKDLMKRQNDLGGDGRKTTAIIANTLIELGSNLDMPRVQLKRELDALIPLVEAKIDGQKRLITVDEVSDVARIAGESDELGDLLGEIYKKIGKDGIIHLEPSNTPTTSYKFVEGVRFADAVYLTEAMTTNKRVEYENPRILVTKRKISTVNDINPILEMCINNDIKDLVIFADDMDNDVARSLVNVHQRGLIHILIIKAPILWKQFVFEDFAKCTGSTIVEDATGITFKNFPLSALGTCGKIITDSKETILLEIKDISEHIKDLQESGDIDSKRRLSWLATKTVNLLLGANGETDLYYKMMKCKDAINASRLALRDGVVRGGGLCLHNIATGSIIGSGDTVKILLQALDAPYKQLARNSGKMKTTYYPITYGGLFFGGYRKEEVNTYEVDDNVLDASLVLKSAVRSAIGLASTALTIGVAIPFLEKTEEELRLLGVTKQAF